MTSTAAKLEEKSSVEKKTAWPVNLITTRGSLAQRGSFFILLSVCLTTQPAVSPPTPLWEQTSSWIRMIVYKYTWRADTNGSVGLHALRVHRMGTVSPLSPRVPHRGMALHRPRAA